MLSAGVKDLIQVAPEWYLLTLNGCPWDTLKPGQFVHLRWLETSDPLLRRPFSVHDYCKDKGELSLLFQVRGKFTRLLEQLKSGHRVDLLGPLGRGFTFPQQERVIMVAGGIGLAPLSFWADYLFQRGKKVNFLIGGSSAQLLPDEKYFDFLPQRPYWATEDGSRGYKGTVVDLLEAQLAEAGGLRGGAIYACGPTPMLSNVVDLARYHQLPLEVSVERVIACGVGACLGCVQPMYKEGVLVYRRVCKDGPVFRGEEVVFDE